jgi:hypothetical protein
MLKFLSPSLLDSFAYYLSIQDSEQSQSKRAEIINRLLDIKTPANEALLAGLEFEKNVQLACNDCFVSKGEKYDDCVIEIANVVRGGIYQHPINVEIDGVLFFSEPEKPISIDFLKINTAYDVKTTKKYEVGKYQFGNQHLVYLLALRQERIDNFVYLVTDFRNVYQEFYQWKPSFRDTLKSNITQFFDYLSSDIEMSNAYLAYCQRKEKACQCLV